MESSSGKNIGPRYEKTFEKRYSKTAIFKECANKHGARSTASSFGEFQIILMVAWENGFKESPEWLANPVNNRVVYDHIIKKIAKKVGSKVDDLVEIGKRYNGSKKYGEKLIQLYKEYDENQTTSIS